MNKQRSETEEETVSDASILVRNEKLAQITHSVYIHEIEWKIKKTWTIPGTMIHSYYS